MGFPKRVDTNIEKVAIIVALVKLVGLLCIPGWNLDSHDGVIHPNIYQSLRSFLMDKLEDND